MRDHGVEAERLRHLLCTQFVAGSNPVYSTEDWSRLWLPMKNGWCGNPASWQIWESYWARCWAAGVSRRLATEMC